MIELIGRKKENGLLKVLKLYDLLFLMLGAYPIRCSLSYNEKRDRQVGNTIYNGKSLYWTGGSFCDITAENINLKV